MKIFLGYSLLNLGGSEASLVNLAECLKDDQIDLFLMYGIKVFNKNFPSNVTMIGKISQDTEATKNPSFLKVFATKMTKVFGIYNYLKERRAKKVCAEISLDKEYDIAISYDVLGFDLNYFILNKLKAKKKILFIHFSYSAIRTPLIDKTIMQFDKIICVSKSCADELVRLVPEAKGKVDFIYNLQDVEGIKSKANEKIVSYDNKKINIISVYRLHKFKAPVRSLKVMRKLRLKHENFCWNVIGDGPEKRAMEKYIAKHNMSSYVKMHGLQKNPYPFIKNANLLYLGSIKEAAPMVYAEAMTLQVPVLTTNVISANELVGEKGFVCENSKKGIYDELNKLLSNPALITEKKEALIGYEYNNTEIKDKIKKVISL